MHWDELKKLLFTVLYVSPLFSRRPCRAVGRVGGATYPRTRTFRHFVGVLPFLAARCSAQAETISAFDLFKINADTATASVCRLKASICKIAIWNVDYK